MLVYISTISGYVIERPDGDAPGEAVQHAHPREAGETDLLGADEIEAGGGIAAACLALDHAQAAVAIGAGEARSGRRAKAEEGREIVVADIVAGAEVGIVRAGLIDMAPQRAGVARHIGEAGEIAAATFPIAIERQSGREIDADDHVRLLLRAGEQPIENGSARRVAGGRRH
jgi:hypothetical protein